MSKKEHYDFVTTVNRRSIGSHKWMIMQKSDGTAVPDHIVPFSVADMELKNPPEIVECIKNAADSLNPYGYTRPTPSYYQSVCSWMQRRHDWKIQKDWIVTSPGVISALSTAVSTLTSPGEGIIIMTPVYYPFYSVVTRNNRVIVENPLLLKNGHYEIDFDDLERKASEASNTMLLLCSPHNPVGRVWTREELIRIGDICIKNNVIVVSDEIHFDIIMPTYQHTVFASISQQFADNSIICTSPSKTFNLAGLQTANIIIPNEKLRKKFSGGRYNMLNVFGYAACECAYTKCDQWVDEMLIHIDYNRKIFCSFMTENFPKVKVYVLEGTYLIWFNCDCFGLDDESLKKFLEDEAMLFLDSGTIFGSAGKGFQRINIACSTSVLLDALERLKNAARLCGLRQ